MKKLLYVLIFLCVSATQAKNTSIASDGDKSIIRGFHHGDTKNESIYCFGAGYVEVYSKQNFKKNDSTFGVEYTLKKVIESNAHYTSQAQQIAAIEHPGQSIEGKDSIKYSLTHHFLVPIIGKTVLHKQVALDRMWALNEANYNKYTESVSYMLIWSMLIILLGAIINIIASLFIENKRWYKKYNFAFLSVGLYMVPGMALFFNATNKISLVESDNWFVLVIAFAPMIVGVVGGVFLKIFIKYFIEKRRNHGSLTLTD